MTGDNFSLYATVYKNEDMKKHTSFAVGGTVSMLLVPKTEKNIPTILRKLQKSGRNFKVIGNGSNILFPDRHLDIVVVKNNIRNIEISDTVMTVSSGTPLTACAVAAQKSSLGGLEFAYGIPGTVGGGIYMNAGAYGGEMSQVVTKTTYCDYFGKTYTVTGSEHNFGYRTSMFKGRNDVCILSSELSLRNDNPDKIKAVMDEYLTARKDKQPLEYPSAGSVFKRPQGMFAGKLIEDCNLKGYTIGGAQVSEKHAGFIVNRGGATADDVKSLIEHIRDCVYNRFGVELECEIEIIP